MTQQIGWFRLLKAGMFRYEGSSVQQERLTKGTDHCDSTGAVYKLSDWIVDGLLMDPRSPGVPLTAGRTSGSSLMIYAVDANFSLNIAFDGMRSKTNAVKHETLFHNADVRAAGEFEVLEGIIMAVNDRSGSYRTAGRLDIDRRFAESVLTALDNVGAPVQSFERARLRAKAGRR